MAMTLSTTPSWAVPRQRVNAVAADIAAVVCAASAGVHAALCLLRGRSFVDLLLRWPFWRIVGGGVVLLLASWAYVWLTWAR